MISVHLFLFFFFLIFVFPSHCEIDAINGSKVKGKIVLCKHSPLIDSSEYSKIYQLQKSGAIGVILVNDFQKAEQGNYIDFLSFPYPVTEVTSQAAEKIFSYIRSTK
jgi:hypothetical protein